MIGVRGSLPPGLVELVHLALAVAMTSDVKDCHRRRRRLDRHGGEWDEWTMGIAVSPLTSLSSTRVMGRRVTHGRDYGG